jgi:branched-chain amino acid transport system substrate-binding protein
VAIRTVFALLLLLPALLAVPLISLAGSQVVQVGMPLNLSGDMAPIAAPCLKGAQLQKKLLAQGDAGTKLNLAFIDTNNSPLLAMASGVRLISLGVPVGMGYADPAFVKAASQIFQTYNTAFVTPMATHPELPETIGDILFMVSFSDLEQARAMAAFARGPLKARRISVWTDEDMDSAGLFSRTFSEEFTASGGTVAEQFFFDRGEDDFSDAVDQLREDAPDAVLVSALPLESKRIVEHIREAGLGLPILGGLWFDTDTLIALAEAEKAENVYFTAPAFRGSERPEAVNFIAAYKQEYAKEPGGFAALCYDATGLIADALKRAGKADRASLLRALTTTHSYPGVTGDITYTETDRMPAKPLSIMGVREGKLQVMETLPAK